MIVTEGKATHDIGRAERRVVRAAERFVADWKGSLGESYDAAMGVVSAVRELIRARHKARK